MTTAISTDTAKHPTPDEAARIKNFLMDFHNSQTNSLTTDEAAPILAMCERLKTPATPKWITGRVASIMLHYYVADLPPHFQKAIASDWVEELIGYPAWAIKAAFAWWISRENKKNTRRPIPGEITEYAHNELVAARVAEAKVKRLTREDEAEPSAAPETRNWTEDGAAEIDRLVKETFPRM